MKTYIFSGLEPNKKGAGRFLQYFITEFNKVNSTVKVVCIKTPENIIIKKLKNTLIFNFLKNSYYFINQFILDFNKIKGSRIIIFHPQSLGLTKTIDLIKNNNEIYIYVLDNFFFCIKSYNHFDESFSPCILCVKDINQSKLNYCKSAPNKISFDEYSLFNNVIIVNSKKITFITQNHNQSKLLKLKYGEGINIQQIGMYTGEIPLNDNDEIENDVLKYDFIFHNTLNFAKGLIYFIELSKIMSEYKFVIPFSKNDVEYYINYKVLNSNLHFVPCTWETGLKDLLVQSRVTIVPSLWSAPIEGSLLKSLYYSNVVAIIRSEYSFSSEIPNDCYINLSDNINDSSLLLVRFLQDYKKLNYKSKQWVKSFNASNVISINKFMSNFIE